MTDQTTDRTDKNGAGDEAAPPSVDEIRHERRTARGYLPPLDDAQAAALDARPDADRTVDDYRHIRRNR